MSEFFLTELQAQIAAARGLLSRAAAEDPSLVDAARGRLAELLELAVRHGVRVDAADTALVGG